MLVVGAGLIGTSVALALRERGHRLWLADVSAVHLHQAQSLGAGDVHAGEPVDVTVVAVPPGSTAQVVAEHIRDDDRGTVTDTASIKRAVQDEVRRLLSDPSHSTPAEAVRVPRYVGGHPLAGRERGGPHRAHRRCSRGEHGC